MQLSLFDEDEKIIYINKIECDEYYEPLLIYGKYIKNHKLIKIKKSELLDIIFSSAFNKKHSYAWRIYYKDENTYWEVNFNAGKKLMGGSTAGFKDLKEYLDSKYN